MTITEFALAVLLGISNLFGVTDLPKTKGSDWREVQGWHSEGDSFRYTAESSVLAKKCLTDPSGQIEFPRIIHGAHEIFLGGDLIKTFGDRSFKTTRSFYGSPILSCELITRDGAIRWQAFSYTKYFARFDFFPRFSSVKVAANFYQETINVMAAGFLALLTLINAIMFAGKLPIRLAASFCLSNLFFSGYFFWSTPGFFIVDVSMLSAHILADSCLFIGATFFFNCLRIQGLISPRVLLAFVMVKLISIGIFLVADSGDSVQFATTLTFPLALNLIFWSMLPLFKKLMNGVLRRSELLMFFALGIFVAFIINDMLVVVGIAGKYPLLAIGTVGAVIFGALSLNEYIILTYRERDYLRLNLESEVDKKTFQLREKTDELQRAMTELKQTQAELVQSAKLASLGTLSAGIAHEINNSLNYVNGALKPLEQLIFKNMDDIGKLKAAKLTQVMKHGLNLTFEIMKSLRNYSGLNQSEKIDLSMREAVDSVVTILKSKFNSDINLVIDIEQGLNIFANNVGIHQMLGNLIGNALDAMTGGGNLTIKAYRTESGVELSVSDTGEGMSTEIQSRIFDPFFTTKEFGKGTGLGLHIVKQEVERHRATMFVESAQGLGTEFKILFPPQCLEEERLLAA